MLPKSFFHLTFILTLPLLLGFSNSTPGEIKSFHQVDENVYRSAQLQKKDMKLAEAKGIKTIINLRNVIDDKQEIKGTQLTQVRIPLRAKKLTYDDIVIVLNALEAAEKPALIHCLHGSDRTGCMVAAYRMLHGMKKEKAIAEFLENQYGYNKKLFPNILELLESIDVQKLKEDLR
ncbi:MAG: dual specificity protein phosphatase family protein [Crocinitomicaceae bacterium]